MRTRVILQTVIAVALITGTAYCANTTDQLVDNPQTLAEIETWWKAGKTLPVTTTENFPLYETRLRGEDTGINVLIDMAHKCDFFTLWKLGGGLNAQGIRTIGSHATLDSVLTPGSPCRIRVPVASKVLPFGWWESPKFNVVLTEGGVNDPGYIDEEQEALEEFVRDGGGVIVSGAWCLDPLARADWSLNHMLGKSGASIIDGTETYQGGRYPALRVDENWTVEIAGDAGKPIYATRHYGNGRIALLASSSLYRYDSKDREDTEAKCSFLKSVIEKAAEGSEPVGGDCHFPRAMGGGGGIYPESEKMINGIVCFYSKNQIPELVETVENDFPTITEDIYAWLPSARPTEPMYMILCSGGGGGWAVNIYVPKEASTISTSADGIRSIFAHEQAHTMAGPCDAASHPFGGNRGEEHAGWFQGKINAKYNGSIGPNRGCNGVLLKDTDPTSSDPSEIFKASNLENWADGHDRMMIWYVWQKLDDRYGPTWYPRWRWVQGQRWADDPARKLTWEESIEDMSIAVGEDLFPFFAKTGKKLDRGRFEEVEFMGQTFKLPVTPIEPTEPGDVCLDPITDFTKPIVAK